MFTGIIGGTGTVKSVSRNTGGRSAIRITVGLGRHARGLKKGDSVALSGVCLTVTGMSRGVCAFEMIQETADLTALGTVKPGDLLNVERSLGAGGRLEGHFVLGHVDGTAMIKGIKELPGEVQMSFVLPKSLARYVVKKGSIALDGASLTITGIRGTVATVSLIPHTMQVTNLHARRPGDRLNVEVDVLARYALKNLPK